MEVPVFEPTINQELLDDDTVQTCELPFDVTLNVLVVEPLTGKTTGGAIAQTGVPDVIVFDAEATQPFVLVPVTLYVPIPALIDDVVAVVLHT